MASKEKKSKVVSGAGFLASFWLALERAVKERGGTDEDLYRLGEEDGAEVIGDMANVVVTAGKRSEPTYLVTVNYGMSFEEMVAAGQYDSRNDDITAEHFPINGTSQVEVKLHLVHLNKVASTDAVLAELDRRGLRPAKIEELLALGAKYPDLQKEFPLVALGSVWQLPYGRRGVACLDCWDDGRYLSLSWVEDGWNESCRFAAVSK